MAVQPQGTQQVDRDSYSASLDICFYLFVCRLHYLKYGSLRAYAELVSAARSADPEVRILAEGLLADCAFDDDALEGTRRESASACQTYCP